LKGIAGKVSVLAVNYNRADLIKETIFSVLNQSYSNLEFVIIDDGSEDDSVNVINEIKDNRIKCYTISHIGHLGKLRNLALSKITGEYFVFIDTDDLMKPDFISKSIDIINKNNADFSISGVEQFNNKGFIKNLPVYKSSNFYSQEFKFIDVLFNRLTCCLPAIVFKNKILGNDLKFNENMTLPDHEFVTFASYYFKGIVIDESLISVRRHEKNMTAIEKVDSYFYFIETVRKFYDIKAISTFQKNKMLGLLHYLVGNYYLNNSNKRLATLNYKKSIVYYPFEIKSYFKLAMTWI